MSERLPTIRPQKVAAALIKAGFILIRHKGSHAHYRKGTLTVTVPIHSKDLRKGTLASILRQAHMTIEEFKKYL